MGNNTYKFEVRYVYPTVKDRIMRTFVDYLLNKGYMTMLDKVVDVDDEDNVYTRCGIVITNAPREEVNNMKRTVESGHYRGLVQVTI